MFADYFFLSLHSKIEKSMVFCFLIINVIVRKRLYEIYNFQKQLLVVGKYISIQFFLKLSYFGRWKNHAVSQ